MSIQGMHRGLAAESTLGAPGTPTEVQLKMAHTILDYMCHRGMNSGNHLTEQELVDEFKISRTPLRAALSYLAEQGVFERRRNRGFFLKLDGKALRDIGLELPQTAEDRLLTKVVEDWFAMRVPKVFSEMDFRRRYAIGRSLSTRLLFRLSEFGVISRNHGHGWRFVSQLHNKVTLAESYTLRMAVEPAAILTPSFELDRALAGQCRHRHEMALNADPEETKSASLLDIDIAFHRMIGISSRNRFFLAVVDRQSALRRIMLHARQRDESQWRKSWMEHLEILAAIERGDREQAAEFMRNHLISANNDGRWVNHESDG